jgi:hypothetical protein
MKRKNKKTINQSNESKEFVLFFSSVYIKTYIDKKWNLSLKKKE